MATRNSSGTPRPKKLLIVDDDEDVLKVLGAYFTQAGYLVRSASTSVEGLALALQEPPALVILGAQLADCDGLELFRQIRGKPRLAHIPIIFIARKEEAISRNAILEEGADDFVIKPFDADILALRVRNAIARTERSGLLEPRTGLPTGPLIEERLAALENESGWARLDVKIEGFDPFRELYGFMDAGEVLLFTAHLIGEVMEEHECAGDFVGHFGGPDFLIVTHSESAEQVAQTLTSRFNEEVLSFYNFMEREQGYITVENAYGDMIQAPLMRLNVRITTAP